MEGVAKAESIMIREKQDHVLNNVNFLYLFGLFIGIISWICSPPFYWILTCLLRE